MGVTKAEAVASDGGKVVDDIEALADLRKVNSLCKYSWLLILKSTYE